VTGKPHQVMAELVLSMCGDVDAGKMFMVGDRPSTDGVFARTLGCRFGLVLSGVSTSLGAQDPVALDGDIVGRDLAAVVDQILDMQ